MFLVTHILFISGGEIVFILFIVLLVFGADKIPEIARGLGQAMRQVKDATNDIKSEITKTANKQGLDLDVTKEIKSKVEAVKDDIEEFGGSVKRKF